ncbi:hypothetical protein GDO81_005629 [Engystomops pustulosus]|uniref:Tudor domain-containing protein n=1 Tax=Engystomops pustulosus TaxID=76066 RepID=A0AAV7CQE3_ENGPU|nr:hypothetical protein GDO81_005629 [Engystomops pustulosus]
MALRLRLILPYTIPGVLALLGWWWFFSRKKDDSHRKCKQLAAPTDVQTDSELTELGPTEKTQSSSRAEVVQMDREGSTPQDRCVVPPVTQIAAVIDNESDTTVEDVLIKNSDIHNMLYDSLQESSVKCDIELCLVDADAVSTTSTEFLQNSSSAVIQSLTSEELHVVPSTEDGKQPCIDEIETVVKMSVLVQCPQSVVNETTEMQSGNTNFSRNYEPEVGAESQQPPPLQNLLSPSFALKGPEFMIETVTAENAESLSNIKSACTEVMREGNCTDILDAFSQCLEKSEQFEEGDAKTYFGNYEAKIVEQLAINIISKVIVAAKQEILASSVNEVSGGNCLVLGEADETLLLTNAHCQQIERSELSADVDSESYAEMDSACESTQTEEPEVEAIRSTEVENLEHTEEFTQMEESLDVNFGSAAVLDKEVEVESAFDMDSTCESTQTEEPIVENAGSISLVTEDSGSDKTEEQMVSNGSTDQTYAMPNLSPVNKNAGFLEECRATMEDSSVSICTSEDGVSMEDQLQSTALSNVGVGPYDSLSSSGIELSHESFNVSSEKIKRLRTIENSVPYSNGDVKRSSVDLKNESPWTGDAEADHSGGSDVNSMDSVDSGFALGKAEQDQNVKQKMEVKKAELIIWEIEVPKHLVGRLIGKQGRYVSFLKESSGAKIYISTLPYTQDYQICHIEGSQQQVDRALSLIGKKFKELNLTNIYAPPPSLALHSLPMTSWLMLPDGVTVEVIVVNVVNAGHMFVQQHTHPTFHALRGLDQQMFLCYSQPGVPTLPTPVEVGVICAAPAGESAWWRAQVVAYYKDSEEVEIRYVDYGGYERVKIEILRQIRSDFVTLPFQGAEVLLDNVIPLADEDHFSAEADTSANEMTRGTALLAQVTNYDVATGLPLVQLWSMMADEVVSINRTLVERGFAQWIDSY